MRLSEQQQGRFRRVLLALHLRDEELGLLPAVDRGPPKGLVDAAVAAVHNGGALPPMHQLPPNVFVAARALSVLVATVEGQRSIDVWLSRNLAASATRQDSGAFPLPGCRSIEDVRNRVLVELDQLAEEQLAALGEVLGQVVDLEAALV